MRSEYRFWKIRQRLEETIQNISNREDGSFDDILKDNSEFEDLIYNELGVVGGAFVLADKSRNELIYLQNKELQRQAFQRNSRLPFIEIPYKYQKKSQEKDGLIHPRLKSVLDALFIGTQDRQLIQRSKEPSPDVFKFLPGILSDGQLKQLLPFEYNLVKDGFKMIYCTVGEVLFHLYLWRYLFRLAQTRGLKNGKIKLNDYEEKFYKKTSFWYDFDDDDKIPEANWMNALKHRYSNNDHAKEIQNGWGELNLRLDMGLLTKPDYSFYTEYEYFGFWEKDDVGEIQFTRAFLQLVRYAIFTARKLDWKIGENDESLEEMVAVIPGADENKAPTSKSALTAFYVLERRLNIFWHKEDKSEFKALDLNRLKKQFQFDKCLRKLAKQYLFKKILKTDKEEISIFKALKALHNHCRFPLITYYYELASGQFHHPKDHMVLSIWNSTENKVHINLGKDQERKPESAVAFVSLTLKPIWDIDSKSETEYIFTKNNESVHWAENLSEESYKRLFRLKCFFSTMSRPLIDRIFYGEILKKEIKRSSTSTDINSFAHEMSKVIDNIYELSNVTLEEMFGKDSASVVAFLSSQYFQQKQKKNIRGISESNRLREENRKHRLLESIKSREEVKDWRIIPNFKRFSIWNKYLNMWTGRRTKLILDVEDNAPLEKIIKSCVDLAANMDVAAKMQNVTKAKTIEGIVNYQTDFEKKVTELKKKKLHVIYEREESYLKKSKLIHSGNDDQKSKALIKQNAFLRILIASITNIFEHTRGNYYLYIRSKNDSQGNDGIRFCFVNPAEKRKEKPSRESFGTKPVLNSCLLLVNGTLEKFGYPTGSQLKHWAKKIGIEDINEHPEKDIWLTKFIIPQHEVFYTD